MDDEYRRQHEEVDLLGGVDAHSALWTVPSLFPRQELLGAEQIQAVIESVPFVGYGEGQIHEGIKFHADVPAVVLPVIVVVVIFDDDRIWFRQVIVFRNCPWNKSKMML